MLKLDLNNRRFESLKSTEMKTENILERFDLQEAIANSWDLFKNEIGYPASFLIGKEVEAHPSTKDSIDLLVYNPDDSSLIVIELKRDKEKLQLLQALSYAAMISKWEADELVSKIQRNINPDPEELIDLITSTDISPDIKIILISEYYDPEVIITADWLSSNYSVDITAFSISLHKLKSDTFFHLEQRYPLKELTDVYEVRGKRKKSRSKRRDMEWEEVLPKLNYSYAERGIELCKKFGKGDPSRRRFGRIRTKYAGFDWISLNFRQNYINVYLKANFDGDQELLQSKFNDPIKINTWRDGLSFLVETESQFEDLVKWLQLEHIIANNITPAQSDS